MISFLEYKVRGELESFKDFLSWKGYLEVIRFIIFILGYFICFFIIKKCFICKLELKVE